MNLLSFFLGALLVWIGHPLTVVLGATLVGLALVESSVDGEDS